MVKKTIVVLTTLFITIGSFAQKSNTSAYSFFGIGDMNSSNTVEQLSMGGIGVSLKDNFHLNLSNPASNSSVGYSLTSNNYVNDELTEVTLYNGSGGTNKVFLGFGYEIFKDFSIGIQGNYLFGKIDNSIVNQLKDVSLATKYQTVANVNSLSVNTGLQYKKELKNKLNLHFGANFNLESEIESKGNEYLYSVVLGSYESPRDTTLNVESTGKLKFPLKSSLGIGVGKENKWYAGIDYTFQKALELDGSIFNNYSRIKYDDSNKISLGGYYTPKFNSIASYWDRVTYRAGLKLERTGLLVDGIGNGNDFTAIDDFGISFGVGLPVSNQLSNLNVGFEFGKRGKITNGLIQENYINFRLSLSLNDKWFRKLEIF